MHLTNPSALWFLILLAIPPLLARRRRPRSRQVVSNLHLWHDVVRRDPARLAIRRLRRNWLVALQMAMMAAAIIAVANPVVAFRAARIALVFDVSMSMGARDGGTTRLDAARERARAILAGLGRTTTVRVVAAGASPRDLGEHAAGSVGLARSLDQLASTAGPADLHAAVRLAATGGTGIQRTYVFSDQPADDGAGVMGTSGNAVWWERVGHPADNVALARMAARRHPIRPVAGQLLIEVRNFGTHAQDSDVEVAQDGQIIGRHQVHVPAGRLRTVLLDIPRLGRLLSARLLAGDALDLDNRRFAVVPDLDRVRVRLVTSGSFFLESVLAANPRIALEAVLPGSAPDLADAHDARSRQPGVTVCDGCSEPPDGGEAALIIPPRTGTFAPAALAVAMPDHPLAASLDPGELFVRPLTSADVAGDGEVVLRAGGLPAAIAYERGGRRILELRIDVAAPETVLSVGFPVLVANAIDWLAAGDRNASEIESGEPVRWLLPETVASELVSVAGPDERTVRRQVQGPYLTIVDTDAPGPYRVRTPAGEEQFVVNPAVESESDLNSAAAGTSAGGVPDGARPADDERNVAAALVLLAFGLLAAEWRVRWRRGGPSS